MALKIYDTVKPVGTFPVAEAHDIQLPDGTRLSDQPTVKIVSALPSDASKHKNILYLVTEKDGDVP